MILLLSECFNSRSWKGTHWYGSILWDWDEEMALSVFWALTSLEAMKGKSSLLRISATSFSDLKISLTTVQFFGLLRTNSNNRLRTIKEIKVWLWKKTHGLMLSMQVLTRNSKSGMAAFTSSTLTGADPSTLQGNEIPVTSLSPLCKECNFSLHYQQLNHINTKQWLNGKSKMYHGII